MTTRREKIESMLADDPQDTFLRYSLAMEWAKEGNVQKSLEGLDQLQRESPPYVPAFFMAAQQLASQGDLAAARDRLRHGIEQARQQGDTHAAGEMSEFLASLGPSADAP